MIQKIRALEATMLGEALGIAMASAFAGPAWAPISLAPKRRPSKPKRKRPYKGSKAAKKAARRHRP